MSVRNLSWILRSTLKGLTNNYLDEIMIFRQEALRNGISKADTELAIDEARKRLAQEEPFATIEEVRRALSEEISRTPTFTKPSKLPTEPTEEVKPELFPTALSTGGNYGPKTTSHYVRLPSRRRHETF